MADELRARGIPVVRRLRELKSRPDIIHGNSRRETLAAVLRFRSTPAIFVCHAHSAWDTGAWFHPRIRRYLGMSGLCVQRLRAEGMPEDRIALSWNWVDLHRFLPRPPLPERPRRALVFSNYAKDGTHLPAISEACRRAGLELDVVGAGVKNSAERPEAILGQYDLVFAKAKAALEAMAVGAAVILCDFGGAGPLVTSADFDRLRPMNFGFEALREPLAPEPILRQIERYDAEDAACVRDRLRGEGGLEQAVADLLGIYRAVIAEQAQDRETNRPELPRQYARLAWDTLLEALLLGWLKLPMHRRDRLGKLLRIHTLKGRVYQTLYRGQPWNSKS